LGRLSAPHGRSFPNRYEYIALQKFPFEKHVVAVMVIEMNGETEKEESIDALLLAHGYLKKAVTNPGVDAYYVHQTTTWNDSLNNKPWRIHPDGSDC
jgi:hypothetical protein